jgi:hypothetical protein
MKESRPSLPNDSNRATLWILSNVIGWSLGAGFGFTLWYEKVGIIYENIKPLEIKFQTADFLGAIIIGGFIAITQGIFLYIGKRKIAFAIKWTVGTFIGVFVGLFGARIFGQLIIRPIGGFFGSFNTFSLPPTWYPSKMGGMGFQFSGLLTGVILGGIIAFGQSVFLIQSFPSKLFWIVANAMGLEIALILTIFITDVDVLFAGAFVGFAYGIITALPFRNFLRYQDVPPNKETHENP